MKASKLLNVSAFFSRRFQVVVLLILVVFFGSCYLLAGTHRTRWQDMFKYDGTASDMYGIERPALLPLRGVWVLVEQESGDPNLSKENFMNCRVGARQRRVQAEGSEEATDYTVTELLLECLDGGRVFVVRGLAGPS